MVDAICVGPKADFDCDGDVDPADFDLFQPCMSYPNESVSVGCVGSDLDGDGDVDLRDFSIIQNAFTGNLRKCAKTTSHFRFGGHGGTGEVRGWIV